MFDDNHINESDLLMRSILESGQEEVPAHIWDGVSAGLDKAAGKKTVVLWWRRSAIAVAAAAAIATGVIINHDSTDDIVPVSSDSRMIAVVEPAAVESDQTIEEPVSSPAKKSTLLAYADIREEAEPMVQEPAMVEEESHISEEAPTADTPAAEPAAKADSGSYGSYEEKQTERFPDDWGEDEKKRSKVRTSLVLSGITGTNSSSQKKGVSMMKRPAITKAPTRTSIKQTSTETTYGIPLSFGAGVKFDFTPRWSLGVGLNYTLLTSKFYGNYTKVGENGAIEASHQSNIRNSQHYLGIPVNAYYNIINQERLNFYAYAGGTVERCLSDRYQVMSTSIVHKEKAKGVQLSANIGIGVEFMLGNHLGLYIDPSLRYYFNCSQPKSIRTAQPLMLGFEMGLRVKI